MIPGFDADQLPISILKLVEVIFYMFATIRIYNAKKKVGMEPIHKLYITSFIGWAFFLLVGSLIMLFGATSPQAFQLSEIVWIFLMVITVMNSYILLTASRVIINGSHILKEKARYVEIVLFLILGIVSAFTIHISVENELGATIPAEALPYIGEFEIVQRYSSIGTIIVIIPFTIYIISVLYLLIVRKKVENPKLRGKMLKMIGGLACIFLGYLYFAILGASEGDFNIFTRAVGHIFWMIAPILLYLSQK